MSQHDPEPEATPGLEPGTGVPPGETPPGEANTAGVSAPQRQPSRVAPVVTIAFVLLLAVMVALLVVGQVANWF